MKELNSVELKKTEIGILRYIDDICGKNKLTYFLSGGSLLGAIRHKGFIPWDDDLDIMMPRPDFMKLVKLLETGDRYRCNFIYSKKDHYINFAKVVDKKTTLIETKMPLYEEGLGVFVDIFPLDGLPNNVNTLKRYYRRIMFYRHMRNWAYSENNNSTSTGQSLIKKMLHPYARKKGWRYWVEKIDEYGRKYDYDKAKYVGVPTSGYDEREVFTKEAFSGVLRVPFEEYEFDIPVGYDEYLTKLYGDYMQLPPEDKRVTRHTFKAYWKETE